MPFRNSTFNPHTTDLREREKVRASRFNRIVDLENGNKLLFNANSGAIAELPPDTYNSVQRVLSSPETAQTAEEKQHLDHLIYGGFLVERDPDELIKLKNQNDRRRFSNSVFALGIAPTFECNLGCSYCDGRKQRGKMSGRIVKQLLNFAKRYVRKCDETNVTWSGGEPLLSVETIEQVQQGLMELSDKYSTGLCVGTLITNGYLLDGAVAERLKAAGIAAAQVSLDGCRENHDSVRGLADGAGTFDTIIANISEATEALDIVLRINVEQDDTYSARALVEYLDKNDILSKVGFYFGESKVGSHVCSDATGRCKLNESRTEAQLRLYRDLADKVTSRIDFPYLTPVSRCGADSDSCFIVAPTGYLFKCWEELSLNVEKSIGSIFSDEWEDFQRDNHWRFASFDPFLQPDCTRCEILPLCMGGCPSAVKTENNHKQYQCSPLRDKLGELLKLRYLYEVREEVI